MEIRAADGVETFVRDRGGRLYMWTSERGCCWGSLALPKAVIAWSPGAESSPHVSLRPVWPFASATMNRWAVKHLTVYTIDPSLGTSACICGHYGLGRG